MKRFISYLALVVAFAPAANAQAQEIPHLEFVRGLRAQNLHDLALEYLLTLSKNPKLSKEVAGQLPLELAKTHLAIANHETDAARRLALFDQARRQLEAFLQANPGAPQAGEANLDLARIVVSSAKAQLSKAQSEEGPGKAGMLLAARAQFEDAEKRLRAASDRIDPKQAQTKLEADFDLALNLVDQVQTYDAQKEPLPFSGVAKKAIEALKRVAAQNDKDAICWQARAWLVRVYGDTDSYAEAETEWKKFDKGAGAFLEPGKRLAKYSYMQLVIRKDASSTKAMDEVIELGREWLKTYRAFQNTPEGYGVRYLLAQTCLNRVAKFKDQKSRDANDLYATAEKLFDDLDSDDNEYTQRARGQKLQLLLKRKPELTQADIGKLANFKECYTRAELEVAQIGEDQRKTYDELAAKLKKEKVDKKREELQKEAQKKFEEQKKKHIQNIIASVNRALELADDKVSAKDRVEAGFLLISCLLETHDAKQLAKQGEELARKYPRVSKAGLAGAHALEAYAQLLDQEEKAAAKPEALEPLRKSFRDLALYLQATWPTELPGDTARVQLGFMALKQKNYAEAITEFGKITESSPQFISAQFQLASAATQALKDKIEPVAGQPSWQDMAAGAYRRIPAPSGQAAQDPRTVRLYLLAKIQLANIHFTSKKFDEMEKLTTEMAGIFAKVKDPKLREDLGPTMEILPVYVVYGKADALSRSDQADRFVKVRAITDPLVDKLKAKNLPTGDPTLIKAILGLALRASVMDGKIDRAKEILVVLQQSAGDFENQSAVLVEIVQHFRSQIDELEKKGKKADRDKTVAQFASFLDELAKQPLGKMKPELVRFLADAYSGLGKHEQAAKLLEKIPKPEKAEDEKFYYAVVRRILGRELRLAGKLDEADKVIAEVLKTQFGKSSLDAKKEEIFLMEAREKFGLAANAWNKLMQELKQANLTDQYNDAFYRYIVCMYKFALKADEKKKKEYLVRAARLIVTLETNDPKMGGLKERYDELLRKEPVLKEHYTELMKGQKKPAGTQ